jgi:hypothetical protein
MSKTALLMSLGFLVGGCAKSPAPVAPLAQINKDLPVICRLVSRDKTVTISAGPNGSVYSVHDAAGQLLLSYSTREKLRLRHPILSHQLDSAIVADAGLMAARE